MGLKCGTLKQLHNPTVCESNIMAATNNQRVAQHTLQQNGRWSY